MNLADLITPDRVIADVHSKDRDEVIRELIDCLIADGAVPASAEGAAVEGFLLREEERSTGIGNGVAVPHCFLPDVTKVVGVFGRSTVGIDFDSVDLGLVYYIVLFVVPESEHALHLQALSAIASSLSRPETLQRLSSAADAEGIYDVLTEVSEVI